MVTIINLTPHDVMYYRIAIDPEPLEVFPHVDPPARREEQTTPAESIQYNKTKICVGNGNTVFNIDLNFGIRCCKMKYGAVVNLPDPKPDVYYIVSLLVLLLCTDRVDLLCPTDLVRDDHGAVIGCRSFSHN